MTVKSNMAAAYLQKLALDPADCCDCGGDVVNALTARAEIESYCEQCLSSQADADMRRFNELLKELYGAG